VRADLIDAGVRLVGMLDVEGWMGRYVRPWGFHETNGVVTLRREFSPLPDLVPHEAAIRKASADDLPAIVQVDTAAFSPLWRYNQRDLEAAARQAATFTMIEHNNQVIGYQLSTRYAGSGHLARLAIHPDFQGRKLGGVLIHNMLHFFMAQGVPVITVNTQADNYQSQRLYTQYGFLLTGHRVPVWTLTLP
jgi:[ribosomal protein S18]-alanine N-acetyltransferase